VHGTGDEERDFVYVDDVVQAALVVMANSSMDGVVFNVASGSAVSIRGLAEIVTAAAGAAPAVRFSGAVRPGDALKWAADISRLTALGFVPSLDLCEGVRRVVEWYDSGTPKVSLHGE
jgi:UDP-glucose 4-epimerase